MSSIIQGRIFFALLLMLTFCASCAEASRPDLAAPAKATSSGLGFSELLVGPKKSSSLPESLKEDLKALPTCFDKDLKEGSGFKVQVRRGKLAVEEGELKDPDGSRLCIKKIFKEKLEGFWIWTPNFAAPPQVGKNWVSVFLGRTPVKIFKGTAPE
jgi:hypothetical protein